MHFNYTGNDNETYTLFLIRDGLGSRKIAELFVSEDMAITLCQTLNRALTIGALADDFLAFKTDLQDL